MTKSKTWRLASRIGHSRCFYSNMECLFYEVAIHQLHRFPRAATREHLIPRQRCSFTDIEARDNVVICSSFMNNLLGDAPLMVKMEVRQAIMANKVECYSVIENLTRSILDAYRVDNRFPWQVSTFRRTEIEQVNIYMDEVRKMEMKLFRALSKIRTFAVQPLDWSSNGSTDAVATSK